jgi:hypothetical protein
MRISRGLAMIELWREYYRLRGPIIGIGVIGLQAQLTF